MDVGQGTLKATVLALIAQQSISVDECDLTCPQYLSQNLRLIQNMVK
jgi:hypothetical protein